MSDDDRTVAASLVSLLKGDAGQRAIVAQAFGWPPAQRASGTNWMAPYLALLLNDPYDAVRYIAATVAARHCRDTRRSPSISWGRPIGAKRSGVGRLACGATLRAAAGTPRAMPSCCSTPTARSSPIASID